MDSTELKSDVQSVAPPAAQCHSLLANGCPGALGPLLSLCDIFKHIIMWAALALFEVALLFPLRGHRNLTSDYAAFLFLIATIYLQK